MTASAVDVQQPIAAAGAAHLAVVVPQSSAEKKFSRQFWRRPLATRLELVAWPNYLATFAITPSGTGARAAGDFQQYLHVYVDAHEPTCVTMVQTACPLAKSGPSTFVPPKLSADEAAVAARRVVGSGIASTARWRTPPEYSLVAPPCPVFWPLWAYYHRRRGGILDVLLLDAVRGVWCGPKLKGAFLAALTAPA